MFEYNIMLPSQPKVVLEQEFKGVYEIDGLYPGYGHTLGNSLRRIILSSLPGSAITSIKVDGVEHEFSTLQGLKEDIIMVTLNLKKVRLFISTDEPQILSLSAKGPKEITAGDIKCPGQVTIMNPELVIAHLTEKSAELNLEMTVERGLGFVSKDQIQKDRLSIGSIALDSIFTPIRRVNYEVENMRVGNRTDFNRLKIFVETDGTISPREALTRSIEIMITQLKAIVGFREEEPKAPKMDEKIKEKPSLPAKTAKATDQELLKTRIENLSLSSRTINSLSNANVRTIGGLVRKKEDDILEIDGIGAKGLAEIKKSLSELGLSLS